MNDKDFQQLVTSVKQLGSIMQGKSAPHRRVALISPDVKAQRDRGSEPRDGS